MRAFSTPREPLLAALYVLVFDERAVVEATIGLPFSVRNVVPGAVAETGSATTANVKTLNTNASDPPMAARRARR
jgi:hypothetical protein